MPVQVIFDAQLAALREADEAQSQWERDLCFKAFFALCDLKVMVRDAKSFVEESLQ